MVFSQLKNDFLAWPSDFDLVVQFCYMALIVDQWLYCYYWVTITFYFQYIVLHVLDMFLYLFCLWSWHYGFISFLPVTWFYLEPSNGRAAVCGTHRVNCCSRLEWLPPPVPLCRTTASTASRYEPPVTSDSLMFKPWFQNG